MNAINIENHLFKNQDSPFTEIFNILTRYKTSSDKSSHLDYSIEELSAMHEHLENAMTVMLRGLQSVGNLMSLSRLAKQNMEDDIGFLISSLGDITKSLNNLRFESNNELRQRGVLNFY